MDFHFPRESELFFLESRLSLYDKYKLKDFSLRTQRFASPLVGLGAGLITLAIRISHVTEVLFKGLVHLFLCSFSDHQDLDGFKASAAANLLIIEAPMSVAPLLISPFEAIAYSVYICAQTLWNPESFVDKIRGTLENKIGALKDPFERSYYP